MKIKTLVLSFTLFIVILLSSCKSSPVIQVKTAPSIEQAATIDVQTPGGLAWSSDSSALYVYSYNHIEIIDIKSLSITVQRSLAEGSYILDVNGEKGLYLESPDSMLINIRKIDSGDLVQSIEYPTYVNMATFSPDGHFIAIASEDAWLVDIFNVETGEIMDSLIGFETAAPVYGVQYSRDGGSLLYFARATLQPQDIATHQMGTAIFHEDFISTFTSSPDGSVIASAAAGAMDGELTPLVYLWDRSDGSQIAILPVTPYVTALDYTPDGKILLIAGGTTLYFAQADDLKVISTLETPLESISALKVSPDGTLIAVADPIGKVSLWGLPK